MHNKFSLSGWFVLLIIIAGFLYLFWWVLSTVPSSSNQTFECVGLLLVFYGLLTLWLKANETVIIKEDLEYMRTMRAAARRNPGENLPPHDAPPASRSFLQEPVFLPWSSEEGE